MEFIPILFILFMAIVLHEYAHGWMAYQLGDPTARDAGRLTLNPIKHIDPVGTILVPGILLFLSLAGGRGIIFGWAKPVPVNFRRLKNPKQSMIWVALAGPGINVALALLCSALVKLGVVSSENPLIIYAIFINLLLAVFNMMPIPPLDGSRVLMGVLPRELAYQYSRIERFGILIVFLLLYAGIFEHVILPIVINIGRSMGVAF